ncbi:nucleotide exchange factor GrpE [Prochlorococcus sp. AH-736-K20]|nr:nucleotide exchange factor GrpE [Prochlorococcus sp. AH-736-K20]MDA9746479.1 nucleotide exchange factor GrpE [Prochlorococcus sp. AH-736-K20]
MIENQSENIENKESDVSNQDNLPEDNLTPEGQINENDDSSSQKTEEINSEELNTEELKNTISNNDARLEQLEKEHETLKNQYVRISADFDNFRKRQSRDQDDLKIQLVSKSLTAILPIVDNFERARQQLKPESEEALALHRSYQGLYKQLVEVLKQQGVAPMRVVGQSFDPNLHEAVLREPSDEYKEDFIVEELQRGYHLEGKVLRHALVKVSMGPGKQNSQEEVEKDTVEGDIASEENTSEDV